MAKPSKFYKVGRNTLASSIIVDDDVVFRLSLCSNETFNVFYRCVMFVLNAWDLENEIVAFYKPGKNPSLTVKKLALHGSHAGLTKEILEEYYREIEV